MCCGTGRENTVNCPLDCVYLVEARTHEKPQEIPQDQIPHRDIRISDQFLHDNNALLGFLSYLVARAGLSTPGAVDLDARDALDSLVRTYRTRESGLYYDSRPDNLIAANIYRLVREELEEYIKKSAERAGMTTVRDADILGSLVFLVRLERQLNNGRPKGRAFLDFLRQSAPEGLPVPTGSTGPSLVVP